MAKRYFAFNTLAGVFRTSISPVESTLAGSFDATRVSQSILIGATTDYIKPPPKFLDGSTSITGTVYLRFDVRPHNGSNVACLILNNAGANAYRIVCSGGLVMQFQYWNGTAWTSLGATWNWADATRTTCMLKIVLGASFELYGGGTLLTSGSGMAGAASAVDEFQFRSAGTYYWSQVMCADYDIRDSLYYAAVVNGEGTYNTDGTGVYTDINETVLNDATAIQLPAAGNKRSFTKPAIAVPVGMQISGMVMNARGRIGGVIADGELFVKQGGTDGAPVTCAYSTAYEPRSAFFPTDPATAAPFSQAGYNSAEPAFEAI